MRTLVLHHERFIATGIVGERLTERGFELDDVQIGDGYERGPHAVPTLDGYDLVMSMGARASVMDIDSVDWIAGELALLTEADRRGIPVIGLCYGGQSLATALGGRVERCPEPEIGWYYIDTDVPEFIASGPWLEWHVDRFEVPPGAKELARSERCPQAFTRGRNLGLQLHPEADETMVRGWVDGLDHQILTDRGLTVDALLGNLAQVVATARPNTARLVDTFLDEIAFS
jgi:GMP synthase-like glutamine amidotransferase